MMGGATATAGGLVFTGEGNGWFKAYDAKTGAVLWQFNCGAGANAAPAVFEVGGEELVAVSPGGNFQISYTLGNSLFVFRLPKPQDPSRAPAAGPPRGKKTQPLPGPPPAGPRRP